MEENGISVRKEFIFDRKMEKKEADALIAAMRSIDPAPTGIYCANDIIAIGLLWNLHNLKGNLFRPSIIASDDIEEGQKTKPMLTTVRLFKEDMGKHAMYLLLDRLLPQLLS